jgi:hypothetical protein
MKLLTDDFWPAVRVLLRKPGRHHVAVAFLSQARQLPLRQGDVLVVNLSDAAVRRALTNPSEVAKLRGDKVDIYNFATLHAKVFVGAREAIVGSGNASNTSEETWVEAGVLVADRRVVSSARAFVQRLRGERVTPKMLARLKAMYGADRPKGSRGTRRAIRPAFSAYWYAGEIADEDDSPRVARLRARVVRAVTRRIRHTGQYVADSLKLSGGRSRLERTVKSGDRVFFFNSDNGEVNPPYLVTEVQRDRGTTMIGFEAETEPLVWSPWSDFHKEARRRGLGSLKRNSLRMIPPRLVQQLLQMWSR